MNRRLLPYFAAWSWRHAGAALMAIAAMALGTALGVAVDAVNRAALDEFTRGMRSLAGSADVQVRGPREGFDESIYPKLARLPQVAAASPVVEVDVGVAGHEGVLPVIGLDLFSARELLPTLVPPAEDSRSARGYPTLRSDSLMLSAAAADWLGVVEGADVILESGLDRPRFRVGSLLPGGHGTRRLALMDIATAQWRLGRLGVLSRIDLRFAEGVDRDAALAAVRGVLPAGVHAVEPELAEDGQAQVSRAYRVNLSMLAMVALVTGALLVFSAQALAVISRRAELAFLRAAGLTRRELTLWLTAEGAAMGLLGGVVGVGLGYAMAATALRLLGGDLGAGYFEGATPALEFDFSSGAGYLLLAMLAAGTGALVPALGAAGAAPAQALKAGDIYQVDAGRSTLPGLLLIGGGVAVAFLPPIAQLPLFGYLSVAMLLVGTVWLTPRAASLLFARLPQRGAWLWQLAAGRLRHAPGPAVAACAGVLASVALAVAMAIMVSSFRDSLDDWLLRVLPAELYVRASLPGRNALMDVATQRAVIAVAGVKSARLSRYESLRIDPDKPPVGLIARDAPAEGATAVALVGPSLKDGGDLPALWASEAMTDLYGYHLGERVLVPIAGRQVAFRVAGFWRDYARQHGAIVIDLEVFRRAAHDTRVSQVELWLHPGVAAAGVAEELRRSVPGGRYLRLAEPGSIRKLSLSIFDRSFAVTYALEAVAIVLGLAGVGTSFAALARLRRREFGLLRHLGLARGEVGALLALEGGLTATLGVAMGMLLGLAISVVLVFVVNRQSFHWSMDLKIPLASLGTFAAVMVALATCAAVLAARGAMRVDAVRAVREDW